jgi:hypothetical protein
MTKPVLSDAQINRRKKLQARISQTTGGLGLASAGAFAAGRLGGTGKYALKAQKVAPGLKRINTEKANTVALGTSVTGGALGGAGSFNFARYTDSESRKRVKKSHNVSAFGVVHD